MTPDADPLSLDDAALLAACDLHVYKASGPGGQHRNKVSSAVKLRHRATGVTAHGDDSRSQHENKRLALRRLRMNLALRIRRPFDPARCDIPAVVAECVFTPRGPGASTGDRIDVGRRDHRFWAVAAFALDVIEACEARVGDAAACIGVTTGSLTSLLRSERHLLGAAQVIRKRFGRKPLN